MQIVINVDNELYEYFLKRRTMHDDGYFSHIGKLIKAFRDGTVLPKGYGRLIDADALKKSNEEYIIAYPMDEEEYMRNTMVRWINDDITDAPTIIEADKKGDIYAD